MWSQLLFIPPPLSRIRSGTPVAQLVFYPFPARNSRANLPRHFPVMPRTQFPAVDRDRHIHRQMRELKQPRVEVSTRGRVSVDGKINNIIKVTCAKSLDRNPALWEYGSPSACPPFVYRLLLLSLSYRLFINKRYRYIRDSHRYLAGFSKF